MKHIYKKMLFPLLGILLLGLAAQAQPSFNVTNFKHACAGQDNGELTVTITGGTAPFSIYVLGPVNRFEYNAEVGQSYTLSGLKSGGPYFLFVQDGVTTEPYAGNPFNVQSFSSPSISTLTKTDNTCSSASADGSVNISASGGSGNYSYQLVKLGVTPAENETSLHSSLPITGLSAGDYEISVLDQSTVCFDSRQFTINNTLTLTASAITVCRSDEPYELTQAVEASIAGGSYTFTGPGVTGSIFDPAAAGSGAHTINIVYQVNGCTAEQTLTANVTLAPTLSANLTHINCYGANTGAIDLTISGGTAPYTIEWEGGLQTEDRTGLTAGTYTVTVTDQNNCPVQQSFTITQAEPIIIEAAVTNVHCKGEGNGAIDISVSGGAGGYSYLWNYQGRTSEDLSGLLPGTYTITVTDSQNCTAEASFIITEPEELTASITISEQVSCFGATDAALSLTVAGGTAPYRYSWSPGGATTQNLAGVGAGTYTVTVTDANECTTTATIVVEEPAVLALTYTTTDATTCGGNQGSIDLTVSGGSGEYSYEWSNDATSQDNSNLSAGTYTVTVRDQKGCSASASIIIGEPAGISAVTAALSQVSCHGAADGALVLEVSGGSGTYTYSWSNDQTTKDLSGLAPGTYTVTVTDSNECSLTNSFTITEPAPLSLNAQLTHVLCAGAATGGITLTVSGGTTDYQYAWSNGATTKDLSNVPADTYTVVVTDANGCSIREEYTITEPAAIVATAVATPASCFGTATGSIELTVSGGADSYTYLWSNGATTKDLTEVAAGTYSVTITDANYCTANVSATVGEPARLLTVTSGLGQICPGASNGWVQVAPSGGVGPYQILWSTNDTSERVENLAAGTYTVTVTDANECTATGSFTIVEQQLTVDLGTDITVCAGTSITLRSGYTTANHSILWSTGATSPTITVTTSGTYWVRVTDRTTGCEGYDEVAVTILPNEAVTVTLEPSAPITCHTTSVEMVATATNEGTAPTYAWTLNGNPVGENTNTLQLAAFADGDVVGVSVTSNHQCSSGPATATYTLNTLPGLSLSAAVSDVSCYALADGAITLSVTGGSGDYTYSWSTDETSKDIAGLTAGEYTVTVQDEAGCTETLTVNVGQPAQLLATAEATNISSCTSANGAITLTVSGGSEEYTYLWSNGATTKDLTNLSAGTYSVEVRDSKGCITTAEATIAAPVAISLTTSVEHVSSCGGANGSIGLEVAGGSGSYTYLWSNGATTKDLTNLSAGTYSVEVSDGNGCVATAEVEVQEPAGISSLSAVVTDADCSGAATGSLVLTVTGGTAPYTYLWSNGATSRDIDNLIADTYTVAVTDANGCILRQNFTIGQSSPITLEAAITNTTACGASDGAIELSVSGGTAPYTYSWNEGAFTTKDLSDLTAGTYTIYIEDAAGCSATATYAVSDGNGPTITATVQDASCFGTATGSISLAISGGTAPYAIEWDGGENSQDISALAAGTYNVRVTDANGCSASASLEVGEPSQINISTAVTDLTSCTSTNGAIALTVSGGAGSYTYSWNTGATSSDLSDLAAGEYTVTVTDARGCTATATATISQPVVISLTTSVSQASSCGASDGAIELSVSGGTAPYTYSWNEGAFTTQNLSDMPAGEYTVTVTDAGGCTATATAIISEPSSISGLTADIRHLTCAGAADGAIVLTVAGGTAPFSYSWSTGATSQNINGLAAGEYTVTVRDANGCSATERFTISEPAAISLTAAVQNTTACQAADGSIALSIEGGVSPYTYSWSNGAETQNLADLLAGSYTVTVTDANGCTASGTYTISDANGPSVTATVENANCFGAASGAIALEVSGGTAPYTYLWSTEATSSAISDLLAGTYTVSITDANGCVTTASYTIEQPSEISISAQVTDLSSCSGSDGAIDVTVTGGAGEYTYRWSNGAISSNLSGLAAGDYSLTVTDNSGCSTTANFTVSPARIIEVLATVTDASSCTEANGTIALDITGGVAPFTFSWSNGAETQNLADLAAGTYTVTVTDAQGCETTIEATVGAPAGITSLVATATPVSCFGDTNGAISLEITGGTAPYTYSWSNGAETQNQTGLAAGTYTVTVTDAAGCTLQTSATIEQPEQLQLSLSGTSSLCAGVADGTISAAVSGGTAPYSYLWSTGASTATITGLTAGTYSVEITDARGCTLSETHTIDEDRLLVNLGGDRALCAPASLTLDAGYDLAAYSIRWSTGEETATITVSTTGTYSVTVTDLATGCSGTDQVLIEIENEFAASVSIRPLEDITCNSDVVILEAVPTYGGDAPTYQWWNAVTGDMVGTGNRLTVPSFNNGDSFMVEMTSSLDCANPATASDVYQILLPNVEAPEFASMEERVCVGSTMPSFSAINGGTLRWYRGWVDPANLVFEGSAYAPTDTEEGTYTYYVTELTSLCGEGPATLFTLTLYEGDCDPVSCDVTPTVTVSILPGSDICAEITTVQLEANVEQVGTNPQYAWFFNDETTPFSTEATAAYTAAGGFAEGDRFSVVVTITDEAFICNGQTTITASQSIRLVAEMPLAVSLSSSAPNGVCPGTPITFTASAPAAGADPTYTFFSMGAGNSVREEQSGRSNSFVLSAPQNGQQVWVEVRVNDPAASCVAAQGSSQPLAVQVLTSEECVGSPVSCEQFTIEVTELVRPSCGLDNGKLVYYITSRTSPFRLSYSLGDRIVQEQVNSPYVLTVDNIPALQNLQVVLGEGANRCVFNYLLEQAPRLDITFEKLPDGDIVCHGENTGKARLTVNGGNAPYQYLLEGASEWQTLNGNTIVFNTLPAGIVNILVRDNADDTCPDVASIEIFNLNDRVEIEYSVTQQANCNDNIGVFRLMNVSGGSTGNGYRVKLASEETWRDFVPGMEFNGLARGRHILNVTDGVCIVNRSIVIPSPGLIALSEESGVMNFTCERPELRNGIFLKIDGSITEVAGPYVADFFMMNSQGQYQLIASEELFNGNGELYKFQLERGSYRVEVRNINREGCPEVAEYVIEGSEIPVPITYQAEEQSIYCEGASGGVLITNLKGAAGLRYEVEIWDADGNLALSKTITTFEYATQESFEILGLPKGLYRMLIKQDQGLCNTIETSQPFELLIRETERKLAVSILGKTVSFPERATGSLSLRVTNGSGTAPYTASLVWMDRVEDQEDWVFASYDDVIPYNATTGRYDLTYHNLPPGVYELTVVDAKGCVVVITETIMWDTNLFIPNIITPNGDGANEVFYIRNKPARTQLTITNRWGKTVYESADYQNDWDGDTLPEGIYFYSIKAPQTENGIHKGWLEIRRGARPN